ncbi:sensor histidine kinase [Tellurirhabdus bombi]|uniref:sensor histidine kinase n=1 Tax=Tellurirhabdus bombi TaxID=2907205 RepID=UPI001F4828B3|nr:sensor histidine kinase [Tellurirhabdus bombi]
MVLPLLQSKLRTIFSERLDARMKLGRIYAQACLVVLPWFVPLAGHLFWGARYLSSWSTFLGISLTLTGTTMLATALTVNIAWRVIKRFPEPHQSVYRVGLLAFLFVLLSLLFAQGMMRSFDALNLYGYRYQPQAALWILLFFALINILAAGLCEFAYAFTQWRVNKLEYQQFEQENLQTQLNEIREQVNPHFLFNSLNSLSVLIGENPQQAEQFVDELAKVYRYLLQVGENRLTTLEAEIQFIRSYSYLLSTRYGAGFTLQIDVADHYQCNLLPPLTLQLLVDNALKHNAVTTSRPLHITIKTTNSDRLLVQNTINKRQVKVPLRRAALATLIARYQQFNYGPIQVVPDDHYFTVDLPLQSTAPAL